MKKLIYILTVLSTQFGFSQVYEAGLSYNPGQIVGEDKNHGSFFGPNVGIAIKKNMHPRISYRIAAAKINSNQTKLTEVSAGVDFNFSEYNLVRADGLHRSTAYIILELTGLFYNNGVNNREFTMAIPMGVGFKKSIYKNFIASIEAKGRVAFTDKLDNGVISSPTQQDYVKQNKTTLDAYYYIGATIYYTFGWPRGSKNQTRF